MAVYHLACRILADGKGNPPARVAKYHGNCALPSCTRPVVKGDHISCTRDNENGVRKGAGVKGAPDFREPAAASTFADMDLPFPEPTAAELAPLGPMAPRETWSHPTIAGSGTAPDEGEWVPRASLECARRLLTDEKTAHLTTQSTLAHVEQKLAATYASLVALEKRVHLATRTLMLQSAEEKEVSK